MSRLDEIPGTNPWNLVETYRDRYQIDDLLEQVDSLDRSIKRRLNRRASLLRRLSELHTQVEEAGKELRAIDFEVEGSRTAGALLIDDILERVRIDRGEGWSPSPVKGYRVWRIEGNRVLGNQVPWPTAELESKCLRRVAGEDLPHSVDRCGPPACGIYAVKDLDMFPEEVAANEINHTVVGVVAMSGKVIEHDHGYRARRARAVALSVYDDGRRLITGDSRLIARLFRDPEATLDEVDPSREPSNEERRAFLDRAIQEEKWI